MQVLAPTKLSLESGVDASWRIEAEPRSGEMLEVPSTSEAIFSHVGRYSVEATTADGKVHTFIVNAKVIRYEIRDLSNEDREIYLSAMHKYYILSQKDGEDLYGKAFKSLSYLVREHLYGAADVSCDHCKMSQMCLEKCNTLLRSFFLFSLIVLFLKIAWFTYICVC